MNETVHNVTDLPGKSSSLKTWSKRAAVVAIATAVVAAIYVKVNDSDSETVNEPTV